MDKIQRQILSNQKEIMLALIRNLQAECYTGVNLDIHKNNKQESIHKLIKAHNKTRDLLWEDSEKQFEEINENADRTNKED
jgi:hypothetical protein